MRSSTLFIAAAAMACSSIAPSAPVRPPQRIVSINLCADQLILALADRGQIAGLTRNAAAPDMSAEAPRAKGLRILHSSAEEILSLDPDLIAGMPASGGAAVRMLDGRRFKTLDLPFAASLEDIYAAVRQTAAAVGHPDRGAALVGAMQADLARIPRNGGGKVAAYYQRRGYMTGAGTLVDDLIRRAGLINLATKLGKPALARLSLEEMVAAHPDYLIIESATDRVTDQGTEMLHHPALKDIPRISLPEAWTVCGGPAYVRAARSISDQIARHR